jgi:hypothetical protein
VNPFELSPTGHGNGQADSTRLRLLELVEQLIVAALPVLDKIPRCHRYRFGARLEQSLFGLIDLVVQAASAGTKTKVFALVDHIEALNALLRIGAERKLIPPRFLGHIMCAPSAALPQGGTLRQIGAMAHHWRKGVRDSGK